MALRLAVALGTNALALWVADGLFGSVHIHGWASYVIGAAVLGFANAVLKPALVFISLPLIVVTFGLFLLVINIAMVGLAEWVAPHFSVDGFWTYVGVVAVLWLVNWACQTFIDRTWPTRGSGPRRRIVRLR